MKHLAKIAVEYLKRADDLLRCQNPEINTWSEKLKRMNVRKDPDGVGIDRGDMDFAFKAMADEVVSAKEGESNAEGMYQDFIKTDVYKKLSEMYPDYNGGQADEATTYLMEQFEEQNPDVEDSVVNKVKHKVKAGIT